MTTLTQTTQFCGTVTYKEEYAQAINKLTICDNNLQHLLNIVAEMDDLEIVEIHIYREG